MNKKAGDTDAVLQELRAFGLRYPGAHTKSPWPGHLDLAVNDKTFAYLSIEGQPFSMSCKLPHSNATALLFPFVKPTGYGLGKSGWVSAEFPDGEAPPTEMLKEWIDESYRAQAPKKLVASLDAKPSSPNPPKVIRGATKASVNKAPVNKAPVKNAPVQNARSKKRAR